MSTLTPLHHSMRPPPMHRRRPQGMATMRLPHELSRTATTVALDIFADCSNAGVPFPDALLAIYLSGLEHGSEITKQGFQKEGDNG